MAPGPSVCERFDYFYLCAPRLSNTVRNIILLVYLSVISDVVFVLGSNFTHTPKIVPKVSSKISTSAFDPTELGILHAATP